MFRIAAGLWLIYMLLLVSAWFSGLIYYFDAMGLLLLAPPICIMLLNLCVLWNRRGRLSGPERMAFAAYILAPLACMGRFMSTPAGGARRAG